MRMNDFLFRQICSELEDAVGREHLSLRQSDKIAHSVDNFWLPRMYADRGLIPPLGDAIVYPGSTQEVSKVLAIANYYKIPVYPWGGGGGSQGGALPVKGGLILDMKRMNRILEFDTQSMTVTAETGIIYAQLEFYANARGYSLMHYPSSINCSTLGGFLAHNGIGVLSTKYGKIDDQCLHVEMVIPNGQILSSAPVPKHSSGPDIKHLFIGSEGTLGIMTKATMKLYRMPAVRKFRAFLFKSVADGLAAGRDMLQVIKPSIIRLYDEAETVSLIKKVIGFSKPGAFMNVALEGEEDITALEEKHMLDICSRYGAEDLGSDYGEKWWNNRLTFFYPDKVLDFPQMFGTMDTVMVYANVEKIYWAMKRETEKFKDVEFIAHFSHWYEWGCMMYDRFIMKSPPEDPDEAFRLHNQIWNAGVRAALENGGVVNDHHGVGIKLGRLMKEQYKESMIVFEGLKKALDPNGIMNPYKMGL